VLLQAGPHIKGENQAVTTRARRFFSNDAHLDASLAQQGQSSFTYIFDGKAIFAHHDVAWRRGAVAVHAQHVAVIADIAMPTLRGARFDGNGRR